MDLDSKHTNDFVPFLNVLQKSRNQSFVRATNSFLFQKYSSSQNYYYTKDINSILTGKRDTSTIFFTDIIMFDQREAHVKKIYRLSLYPSKIKYLSEYYKFHEDVPRFFQKEFAHCVYNFYDIKRRIKYITITKFLSGNNERERINIHDSEALSITNQGISSNLSLLNLIPADLKASLNRKQDRLIREDLRKKGFKSKENGSITVHDLCDFLREVFVTQQDQNSMISKPMMTQPSNYDPSFSQSLLNTNNADHTTSPFQMSKLIQTKINKGRLISNEKIFNVNSNTKNIMIKKFNNDKFLKVLAKKLLNKDNSKNQESIVQKVHSPDFPPKFVSKSLKHDNFKNSQQLQISNLNININFNNLTKTNQKANIGEQMYQTADVTTKNGKNHRILITVKNDNENIEMVKNRLAEKKDLCKIESPTYSLLQKFKQGIPILIPQSEEVQADLCDKFIKSSVLKSQNQKGLLENFSKLQFRKKKSADKRDLPRNSPEIVLNRQPGNQTTNMKNSAGKKKQASSKIQTTRSPNTIQCQKSGQSNFESFAKCSLQKFQKNAKTIELKCTKNANMMYEKNNQKGVQSIVNQFGGSRKIFMSQDGNPKNANFLNNKKSFTKIQSVSRKDTNCPNSLLKAHRTMENNNLGYFYNIFEKNNFLTKTRISAINKAKKTGFDEEQTMNINWKNGINLHENLKRKDNNSEQNFKVSRQTVGLIKRQKR